MIYNIPKMSNYTYRPQSDNVAWIMKLIYPCRYSGLSINRKYHWFESMPGTKYAFYASWTNIAGISHDDL